MISSPELNSKFAGLRSATPGEISDGIDNNENGYVDDIFGIDSKKLSGDSIDSVPGGFITLTVAKDRDQYVVYSTIDAAQAFLYSLHRSPDRLVIPYSSEDKILNRLAVREGLIGIGIDRKIQLNSAENTTVTSVANAAHLTPRSQAARSTNSSPRGDLLGAQMVKTDDQRICSYYLDRKNKEQVYLSRLDGKQILGKSNWTVEALTAKIVALKAQIAAIAPSTEKVIVRQVSKLKKKRDQYITAKRQALGCKKAGYNPEQPARISYAHIRPILENKCVACHVPRTWKEISEEYLIQSGRVVPGKIDESILYTALKNNPEGFGPADMPQGMDALSDLNIMLIRMWIAGLSSSPEAPPEPPSPPQPPLDPNTPLKNGQKLYADNCSSCHNVLANSTKSGKSYEAIKAALDPTNGQSSMRALGRILTDEQIKLIALALNTKVASEADNWSVNIGTASYVASLFKTLFLPDDPATWIAQDTTINNRINTDIFATNKLIFFGGRCDRFETSCLAEGERASQKPVPNVIRTGLYNRLVDDLLSSTNPRAVTNVLVKIGRTTTSPIDAKAVQDL